MSTTKGERQTKVEWCPVKVKLRARLDAELNLIYAAGDSCLSPAAGLRRRLQSSRPPLVSPLEDIGYNYVRCISCTPPRSYVRTKTSLYDSKADARKLTWTQPAAAAVRPFTTTPCIYSRSRVKCSTSMCRLNPITELRAQTAEVRQYTLCCTLASVSLFGITHYRHLRDSNRPRHVCELSQFPDKKATFYW